jgi:hypothetical protein
VEADYHKVEVWHECPNCKKKILLSLAVKNGDSVVASEIIGVDKP